VVTNPGAIPLRLVVTLDSADGRWTGSATVPAQNDQTLTFGAVARTADSLVLTVPAGSQLVVMRLRFTGSRLDGVMTGPSRGTVSLVREGAPEATALVAQALRVEESRNVAKRLAQTPAAPAASADPDSAKLITSDIRLFWDAVDRAPNDSLAAYLQREYLDRSSPGAREFIPGRILSAEDLAVSVVRNRARYDSLRLARVDVSQIEPAIREAFRRLKSIYPPAVFPDVYFVIGRFNSGGTATKHGLLIGAEMYSDATRLPAIVAHELIHFQQRYPSPTLLEHSFMEGAADFIGEMISGAQINNDAHRYGLAHERELWQEFRTRFDAREFFPWMYGRPNDGRPSDLGYFIGYRIAQAYHARATDKSKALREIIAGDRAGPGSIRRILAESGYSP
jgi:hypothetical protein